MGTTCRALLSKLHGHLFSEGELRKCGAILRTVYVPYINTVNNFAVVCFS